LGELQVELIESRPSLPLTAADWNALVARNETNTVFQTYEWFDAWWKTLAGSSELFLLLVRDNSAIVGFAALMRRKTAMGLRQIEFVGTGSADYQDFVLPVDKPKGLLAILRFLSTQRRRWDRLRLTNVPRQSSTVTALARIAVDLKFGFVDETVMPCPVLILEDRTEAIRELLGRYSLRRPLNWFTSRGSVRWRCVTDIAEIEALLPAFFEQHVARWRMAGKPSLFESPQQRDFYKALAQPLRSAGWLWFSVVEFDGKSIAFHFGFDYNGNVMWYKPTFAPEYAARSPGLLLVRQLIEDALTRSKKELDFTIGDEAFKARFANQERFNGYVSVYSSPAAGYIAAGIKVLRRSAGQLKRRLARARTELAPSP
jgi:CelD/BcsL family acetyltransferase involved in cellulose biosynthesis